MAEYAGVLVFHRGNVLLVHDEYPSWGGPRWTLPSGRIEPGESATEAAVREAAEEAGVALDPARLELVWKTRVATPGGDAPRSWNFTTAVDDGRLCPDDPEGTVDDARWFGRDDAIIELALLPYPPLREPAIAFLRDGLADRDWLFEPVDGGEGRADDFTWSDPKPHM